MADKNVSVLTSGSYTGSQTVREFEVTDLKVEDGKLNGTAIGSVEKEGTGIVDKVRLSFTDVPIDGVGGGSGVKVKKFGLGRWSGSLAPIASGSSIQMGTCEGNFFAPVGNILQGRTIIDYVVYPIVGINEKEPAFCGKVFATFESGSVTYYRDLRELSVDELANCTNGAWFGEVSGIPEGNYTFAIYAIVIL